MFTALFLLLQGATAAPAPYDFRNWHVGETLIDNEKSCSFALSPNFYGVTMQYRPSRSDVTVAIDSPGAHVLPMDLPIPLKIDINGATQMVEGRRSGQQLIFPINQQMMTTAMNRPGMIQILLDHPSKKLLIARYRMRGADYVKAFARFDACRAAISPPTRIALATPRD